MLHTQGSDTSPSPLLFVLDESRAIGTAIAKAAGLDVAPLEQRAFEEGEFKLRPLTSVRGRTVFVAQSLASSAELPVGQRLIRFLFLLFGLRDAGAAEIVALVPYMAFARKDRRTQARDPVNSRYIAQLLEATKIDRLITLDVHNPAALDNAFRIPVDHLSATPMFVDHFARIHGDVPLAVASPDVGGVKRAQIFQELLEQRLGHDIELVFIEKRRARGEVHTGRVVGEVQGRDVIVLDDLCASGGTLIRAATILRECGARNVHVAFTHAPLPAGVAALESSAEIAEIVLTDSVASVADAQLCQRTARVKVLPVSALFGEAVARIIHGMPLTPLLQSWPPEGSH